MSLSVTASGLKSALYAVATFLTALIVVIRLIADNLPGE